jgi:hypothetical protein
MKQFSNRPMASGLVCGNCRKLVDDGRPQLRAIDEIQEIFPEVRMLVHRIFGMCISEESFAF